MNKILIGCLTLIVAGCAHTVKPEMISLDPPDYLMEPPKELQPIVTENEDL